VFGTQGLSILDWGVKLEGYTSDVTMTFVKGPLTKNQEKLISLVEKAYNLALSMCKNGTAARDVALAVDALFAKSKKVMPHALGHGVGLETHEFPSVNTRSENDWVFQPGMITTLEPGLYDPAEGGCRKENDVLITEGDPVVLTNSRIVYL
jgi:Xaa-Pro dipeptidase